MHNLRGMRGPATGRRARIVAGAMLMFLLSLEGSAVAHEAQGAHPQDRGPEVEEGYSRTVANYEIPDVMLVDTDGKRVSLRSVLDEGKPVMVNFIFTTCPTICPLMSAVFSTVRENLGVDREKLRMVSISIDPENDTPAVLREYARQFDADPEWRFLTGTFSDIVSVQRAFHAYKGSKMAHPAVTFLRSSPRSPWVRIEGIQPAEELEREARTMIRTRNR